MVRTYATGQGDQTLVEPVRGRGHGRGRGTARAAAGAVPMDPPVIPDHVPAADVPVGPAQAPFVPIVIPGLQETLAQILTACTSLAQAVVVSTTAATSQAGGGTQTPAACTPEQVVQGLQTPGAPLAQPVAPAQDYVVPVMPYDEQQGEDAQGFLDKCQSILRTTGILETSGVSFTTFQFSRASFTWLEAYERRRPVGAAPLTWQQFSTLFLKKYVPQSRREELCRQFEKLR
ncbi:uncharacterized protein [Nicotiana tomentosiformis]|uniref:uncharacterized protein n=1 Tax=Nicotiana tomentosiformis TaxID=4098 RepID=UPI00388C8BB1